MEAAVARYYATDSLETQGGTLDIAAFGGPLGIRWDENANRNLVLHSCTTPFCVVSAHCAAGPRRHDIQAMRESIGEGSAMHEGVADAPPGDEALAIREFLAHIAHMNTDRAFVGEITRAADR